jgi:type IV pilus assembly protein PilV
MRARPAACTAAYPAVHCANHACGFTLPEVLVALFVVALGVAGAAGVQAMAVRAAGEAARLSEGMQLAASLAQRMRANPLAMALPDGANPYLQFDAVAGPGAAPPVPVPASCYGAANCNPEQLAGFDLGETAAALAGRFPGGHMRVCRDAQEPDAAGLLAWPCSGDAAAPVVIKLGWRGRPGAPDAPAVLLTLGSGTP